MELSRCGRHSSQKRTAGVGSQCGFTQPQPPCTRTDTGALASALCPLSSSSGKNTCHAATTPSAEAVYTRLPTDAMCSNVPASFPRHTTSLVCNTIIKNATRQCCGTTARKSIVWAQLQRTRKRIPARSPVLSATTMTTSPCPTATSSNPTNRAL